MSQPLITRTDVRLVKDQGNLLGFATIQMAGMVEIPNFKILKGEKNIYVGVPNQAEFNKDGTPKMWVDKEGKERRSYKAVVNPVSDDGKKVLETAILNAYAAKVASERASEAAKA